ncbi:hypothetical protein BKA70DRAFT_1570765 [Coprinopsis sp. MPI-PUGE-AT-0042]|nr:hypothetical protein BKA70DRAFT_1570765 [Coprinopsis sp. MPI-PUGE-AT-0042]
MSSFGKCLRLLRNMNSTPQISCENRPASLLSVRHADTIPPTKHHDQPRSIDVRYMPQLDDGYSAASFESSTHYPSTGERFEIHLATRICAVRVLVSLPCATYELANERVVILGLPMNITVGTYLTPFIQGQQWLVVVEAIQSTSSYNVIIYRDHIPKAFCAIQFEPGLWHIVQLGNQQVKKRTKYTLDLMGPILRPSPSPGTFFPGRKDIVTVKSATGDQAYEVTVRHVLNARLGEAAM